MSPFENEEALVGLFARCTLVGNKVKEVAVPLTGVAVEGEVVDFIAEVKLHQCYENTEAVPIEATYHFPVDEAAAVCGFQAEYEDGTVIKGIVKEKAKAREEYKQAMGQGKQANLLEATKRDIFTLNVGNVPAGGFVKITITYVTSLKAQDDAAVFVLPTYISPRYSPARHLMTTKEAQAVSPPTSSIKLFGLDIKVKFQCASDIKVITSPTHSSELTFSRQVSGKARHVSLVDITMERDLVILVTEEHPHQPRASVEMAPDGSMAGFVTLFPQIEFKNLAREFVFVIDRSGSMDSFGSQEKSKMRQASEALLLFLRALPPSCSFNIVGFGSRFDPLFPSPRPYNDKTLEEASRYAMNMKANMGGTEITAPLQHVLGQKCSPRVQRQVFVLTDGQVSNDSQAFDVIRQHCFCSKNKRHGDCRLFSLGVGTGVSRHLVEGMARAGRGTARFVEGGDASSLRVKVLGQLKQALQPALDDVSIEWNFPTKQSKAEEEPKQNAAPPVKTLLGYRSPEAEETPDTIPPQPSAYPSAIPPIFNKERFLSFAIFPEGVTDMPKSVTVKCNSPDGPLEHTVELSDEVFHGTIAHKMAARAAISEFEDSQKDCWHRPMQTVEETNAVSENEALHLALSNSLVSEKTSFIAVLEKPVIVAGTETVKRVIQQHVPETKPESGWEASQFDCMASVSRSSASRSQPRRSMSYGMHHDGFHSSATGPSTQRFVPPPPPAFAPPAAPAASSRFAAPPGHPPAAGSYAPSMHQWAPSSSHASSGFALPPPPPPGPQAVSYLAPPPPPAGAFTRPTQFSSPPAPPQACFAPPPPALSQACFVSPPLDSNGVACSASLEQQSMLFKRSANLQKAKQPSFFSRWDRKASSKPDTSPKGVAAELPQPDGIMGVCLLQKADGSFALDGRMAKTVGLPSIASMESLAAKFQGLIASACSSSVAANDIEPVLFATLLAVAAMRGKFATQKATWELQEDKAVLFLLSNGLARENVDSFVASIQAQL